MPNFKEPSTDGLVNIPSNNFIVQEVQTETRRVWMKSFAKGLITLSGFAIIQFIEGADLCNDKGSMYARHIKLLVKLAKAGLINRDTVDVELTIDELQILREWLEARMSHCEKERDQRTMITVDGRETLKFNPDTYIGMKLLLLDIREAMMGEIVPDKV